jgi:hypothetical protein
MPNYKVIVDVVTTRSVYKVIKADSPEQALEEAKDQEDEWPEWDNLYQPETEWKLDPELYQTDEEADD